MLIQLPAIQAWLELSWLDEDKTPVRLISLVFADSADGCTNSADRPGPGGDIARRTQTQAVP